MVCELEAHTRGRTLVECYKREKGMLRRVPLVVRRRAWEGRGKEAYKLSITPMYGLRSEVNQILQQPCVETVAKA